MTLDNDEIARLKAKLIQSGQLYSSSNYTSPMTPLTGTNTHMYNNNTSTGTGSAIRTTVSRHQVYISPTNTALTSINQSHSTSLNTITPPPTASNLTSPYPGLQQISSLLSSEAQPKNKTSSVDLLSVSEVAARKRE